MQNAGQRQFVKVSAPAAHAGIGSALRDAFAPTRDAGSCAMFADLLARLD